MSLQMYYTKVGQGEPIVFLHGWGCDGSIFLPIVQHVRSHSCYLVDLPGFGNSPMPPTEGWNVTDYAMALYSLIDSLNLSPVTIVGHSFGCRVAMVFAAMYPQYVGKLLLVAPAGLRRFSVTRLFKVAKYKLHKFFSKVFGTSNKTKYGSTDYKNCSMELKNTFVKVVNQNLAPFAKRIQCKVLILNGVKDNQTPLYHAKRLNKIIPHSNLVALNGDHFCFFTNPQSSATVIQMFA